jgi:hypothetical protein
MMVQSNAMFMPVDYDTSSGAASGVSSNYHMPMVCCNAMAWTDKTEEAQRGSLANSTRLPLGAGQQLALVV